MTVTLQINWQINAIIYQIKFFSITILKSKGGTEMAKSLSDEEVRSLLENPSGSFFPSPEDWRDQWIYFLLVDRFNNPDNSPDPPDYPCNVYQGGTFRGIIKQLPYLKTLGVGAIWISPVLYNPQWFKIIGVDTGCRTSCGLNPVFAAIRQKPKRILKLQTGNSGILWIRPINREFMLFSTSY